MKALKFMGSSLQDLANFPKTAKTDIDLAAKRYKLMGD